MEFDSRAAARVYLRRLGLSNAVIGHALDEAADKGAFSSNALKIKVTYKNSKWTVTSGRQVAE